MMQKCMLVLGAGAACVSAIKLVPHAQWSKRSGFAFEPNKRVLIEGMTLDGNSSDRCHLVLGMTEPESVDYDPTTGLGPTCWVKVEEFAFKVPLSHIRVQKEPVVISRDRMNQVHYQVLEKIKLLNNILRKEARKVRTATDDFLRKVKEVRAEEVRLRKQNALEQARLQQQKALEQARQQQQAARENCEFIDPDSYFCLESAMGGNKYPCDFGIGTKVVISGAKLPGEYDVPILCQWVEGTIQRRESPYRYAIMVKDPDDQEFELSVPKEHIYAHDATCIPGQDRIGIATCHFIHQLKHVLNNRRREQYVVHELDPLDPAKMQKMQANRADNRAAAADVIFRSMTEPRPQQSAPESDPGVWSGWHPTVVPQSSYGNVGKGTGAYLGALGF